MSYELVFHELALKEWKKLDKTVQQAFKKKLQERLQHPRVESAKLSSMPDCYKIKLVSLGYRLVYRVCAFHGWRTVIPLSSRTVFHAMADTFGGCPE